jgi:hypothetical protein
LVDELKAWRAVRGQRVCVPRAVLALPGLCLTQRLDASELERHEVVTRKHFRTPRSRVAARSFTTLLSTRSRSRTWARIVVDDERNRRGIQRIGN